MRLNSTSAVILGVLHDGAATGGEIVNAAARRLVAQGGVTRSQVYRELPALAEAGLISTARNSNPYAKPYAITPAGKRVFREWATGTDGLDSVRCQAVLRLGFAAHLNERQRQVIIQAARISHEKALTMHRESADDLKRGGDAFATAAAEFAVAYERAFLKWLDSVPRT